LINSTYSKNHILALNELADYADKNGIAEGNRKSYLGRTTWWGFLKNIELIPKKIKLKSTGLSKINVDYPNSLQEFVSINCLGNIDDSVLQIDSITRDIAEEVETTNLFDLLDHLQVTCSFMRDISAIIKRSKHRPERNVKQEDSSTLIYKDDFLLSPSIKSIKPFLNKATDVRTFVIDNRSLGPRTPSPILSGFCLVCHRICSSKKYFCELHTSSVGPAYEIKKSQRLINQAFKNLGMKLPFEHSIDETKLSTDDYLQEVKNKQKELNISKEMAFRDKSYALEGWAKHHSDHKKFHVKMLDLIKKHDIVKDNELLWTNAHVDFFEDIIQITKTIPHVSKIFHASFKFKNNHVDLKIKLLNQVFDIEQSTSITPATAITMLYRLSQINLIRLASTKKGAKQLLAGASKYVVADPIIPESLKNNPMSYT
jgi:hypothetical protein